MSIIYAFMFVLVLSLSGDFNQNSIFHLVRMLQAAIVEIYIQGK